MLETRDLACVRGERTLFARLSCAAGPGTLLRVAGPNGTGKTSLLRLITGLLAPTDGNICWRGENIRALREDYWKELAYLGHLNAVKDDLTCVENLRAACSLAGLAVHEADAAAALAALGMAGRERSLARFLSQGQKRRIALARLELLAGVPLWILDEPFTALDLHGVDTVRNLIAKHLARDGIVVFTTHQEVDIPAPRLVTVNLAAPGGATC